MKCAIYARVSTKNGNQNPELQLTELRDYARARGYEVIGEFVDVGHKRYPSDVFFHRVRLSWGRARHLQWRLLQEGLNKATIYPGYKGVVLALAEGF